MTRNIGDLSKLKLLLNIIKGLVPALLLGLVFFAFSANISFILAPIIFSLASPFLGMNLKLRKNYSAVIADPLASLAQNAIFFLTLPYEAYISIDACLRSIYRMLISREKMLEWKTAEMAEKDSKNGKWLNYFPT
ncbi:hypothetical protein, partial [Treponema sp. R6D11]